ncbi:hypothetical protein RO3G_02162 [Rhizopus delemar RA 99-880]|uniref:Uncharacterized protein n=1 Tax=Rhizopus delemar (strain RA 99-880 / ATCC MYA-4621 / FGSC 9543 / NRRL 43880) TaxID=246409 RepID=I1BMM8_RHIO9|nr:hypothetical protein RO3G_02162 [Rhizopus delemar RA 99-880]|eukprot:EIE77458.1 hypothetical protein RO3G_02162 [Rhizopus delemar RA 99-880]
MSFFRSPSDYTGAPPWPSLYWPFGPGFDPLNMVADTSHSLYYLKGIWAFFMFAKSRTLNWHILVLIPFLFVIGGAIASFVISSIIGVAIAVVYNAGFFVMSTWIPFLWALIHILIVIVGSYSTITAIL